MNSVFESIWASQSRTTFAVISGPLSERMCAGMPCLNIASANVSMTPKLLICRATRIARHSRVYSSINVNSLTDLPSCVWAYDFVEGRTHDGRKFRILTIIDEASRECLALVVARRFRHEVVLAALAELFIARGPPANIRSDNGSEFIATVVQKWLAKVGVKTLYITAASHWENGYSESFNGSLRDELLDGEIFYRLTEAKVLIEAWRRHYNTIRPHSSLGIDHRPRKPRRDHCRLPVPLRSTYSRQWRRKPQCTNILIGLLDGGRSIFYVLRTFAFFVARIVKLPAVIGRISTACARVASLASSHGDNADRATELTFATSQSMRADHEYGPWRGNACTYPYPVPF